MSLKKRIKGAFKWNSTRNHMTRSSSETKRQSKGLVIPDHMKVSRDDYSFELDKDNFRIKLGKGASGIVYQGWFRYIDAQGQHTIPAAIKEIDKKDDAKAFEREFSAWRRFRHRHIVRLYGVDVESNNKSYFAIMQFCEEGNLKNFLELNKDLDIYGCVTIAMHVADAMQYMHVKKILHRDLSPKNILMTAVGEDIEARVSDFGCSIEVLKAKTAQVGTRCYMAPEAYDSNKFTEKSDVFSFGMVMYFILTGHPPFGDRENYDLMNALRDGERPELPRINEEIEGEEFKQTGAKDVYREIRELLTFCWEHDPELRPTFESIHRVLCQFRSSLDYEKRQKLTEIRYNGLLKRVKETESTLNRHEEELTVIKKEMSEVRTRLDSLERRPEDPIDGDEEKHVWSSLRIDPGTPGKIKRRSEPAPVLHEKKSSKKFSISLLLPSPKRLSTATEPLDQVDENSPPISKCRQLQVMVLNASCVPDRNRVPLSTDKVRCKVSAITMDEVLECNNENPYTKYQKAPEPEFKESFLWDYPDSKAELKEISIELHSKKKHNGSTLICIFSIPIENKLENKVAFEKIVRSQGDNGFIELKVQVEMKEALLDFFCSS